jgi:hypothetical protein
VAPVILNNLLAYMNPHSHSRTRRRLPVLALALGGLLLLHPSAPAQDNAAANAGDLPPAREIIDRFIEKLGGEEAIRKHTSTWSRGTFGMPAMGLEGTLVVHQAAPDKMLVHVNLPGVGEIKTGYDGKVGWEINPMTGPRLIQGAQLEQTRADYDFYGLLHDAEKFESMETVERTTFEGQPAYKIKLVRKSGVTDYEFFHTDTGLQIGSIVTRDQPTGRMEVTNIISDYEKFGGQLLPTRIVQKLLGMQQEMKLTEVEFDKVDPTVFELPPEIKALSDK